MNSHPTSTDPLLPLLVGLGPLIAAADNVSTAVTLGLATAFVLVLTNVFTALLAPLLPGRLRAGAFLLLIAAQVTAIDLLMQAGLFGTQHATTTFIPLIVTSSLILERATRGPALRGLWPALADGLRYGGLSLLLLAGTGAVREALAPGLPLMAQTAGALFMLAALAGVLKTWQGREALEASRT